MKGEQLVANARTLSGISGRIVEELVPTKLPKYEVGEEATRWFVKKPVNSEKYKVSSINPLGGQRVMYRTYLEGLEVRYFTQSG
jgi:hypothetical protein